MTKIKQILNFYTTKLALIGLTLLFTISCGREDAPYDKSNSLDDFNEAQSLGEVNLEQIEINKKNQLENKTPIPDTNKEIKLDDNLDLNEKDLNDSSKIIPEINTAKKEYYTNIGVLKKELSSKSKIIQITENLQFAPLKIERYNISELKNGSESILLDQKIFHSVFNSSMPAISKVTQTISNGLWVGFTNGEVINFKNNIWSKRIGGPSTKKVSIKEIIETNKGIFVASRGLYQFDESSDKFMSSDSLKNELITDIKILDEETLIFTTPNNIQSLSLLDKTTKTIYNSFTGDYPITNVFLSTDNIEIAGKQGILTLSKNGYPLSRTGTSINVKQICNLGKNRGFIIADSGQLVAFENQNTYYPTTVELSEVSNCFINSKNQIYLTISDYNLFKSSSDELFEYIRNNQKIDTSEYNKVFINACSAAEELISGSRIYSKQISSLKIDDEQHVFFNGTQACPNRKGFMRADGLTITVDGKSKLNLFEYNSRKTLLYPDRIDSSKVTKVFIDSNKNIYLGTQIGLFVGDGSSWKTPDNKELSSDFISDIIEDSRGNIWISSRIKNSSKEDTAQDYNALHVKTVSQTWAHFGKQSGIHTLGISSLESRNNILYFGTPYGYSTINQNSSIHTFSKNQGVLDFIVENISIDSKERIWLSHGFFQNGISWIDNKKYFTTDQSKGLFSNRIIRSSEDDSNRIWLMDSGGEVGVYSYNYLLKISQESKFYPERATINEFKP